VSASKIHRTVQAYNKNGQDRHSNKPWVGRREERTIMTVEEEKMLLSEVEGEALKGKILIYKHIKAKVEKNLGVQFQMIIFGIYLSDITGRRHAPVLRTQKQTRKSKTSIKKTQKVTGNQNIRIPFGGYRQASIQVVFSG
jgi:hypothetical protein